MMTGKVQLPRNETQPHIFQVVRQYYQGNRTLGADSYQVWIQHHPVPSACATAGRFFREIQQSAFLNI